MFQKILILISSQDLVGGSYQRNFFIGKVSLWFLLIYTWYTKVLNIFDKWFTTVFCSVALYGHLKCGSSESFLRPALSHNVVTAGSSLGSAPFYHALVHFYCLCHLDIWLVRLFLVSNTFPQKSQVSGLDIGCIFTCIIMLSFLFQILAQTEHSYSFSEPSIISLTRLSGDTARCPEGLDIS